jgi:hypothetical protein
VPGQFVKNPDVYLCQTSFQKLGASLFIITQFLWKKYEIQHVALKIILRIYDGNKDSERGGNRQYRKLSGKATYCGYYEF